MLLSLCDFNKNKQGQVWGQYRKVRKRVSGAFCLNEPVFQLRKFRYPRGSVSSRARAPDEALSLGTAGFVITGSQVLAPDEALRLDTAGFLITGSQVKVPQGRMM